MLKLGYRSLVPSIINHALLARLSHTQFPVTLLERICTYVRKRPSIIPSTNKHSFINHLTEWFSLVQGHRKGMKMYVRAIYKYRNERYDHLIQITVKHAAHTAISISCGRRSFIRLHQSQQ